MFKNPVGSSEGPGLAPESEVTQDANLLSRLDRIPITRTMVGILAMLCAIWLVESFDIGVISTLVLVLKPHWGLTPSTLGLLGASGTIGLIIAIFPAGRLADKYGRKPVVIIGVAVFSIFTLVSAAATNIWWLVALRFIAGLGEGAVFPMPYTMLSELINKTKRGRMMGWVNGILNAGYTLPALGGLFATTYFGWNIAWRVPLFICGGLLILVPILIKWLPETPRFLLKRGRLQAHAADQARVRAFVERLEDQAGIAHDDRFVDPDVYEVLERTRSIAPPKIRHIFQAPYLLRGFVAWCMLGSSFVVWYTFLTYSPTLLKAFGAHGHQLLLFTAIMMFISAFGIYFQGRWGDRWGRRPVFVAYIVLAAAAMIIMPFRDAVGTPIVFIAGVVVAWFGLGSFSLSKLYAAEQYPTRLRGLGTSTAELVTRTLMGGVLVYFIPTLFAAFGTTTVFISGAILMLVLLVPLIVWGHETMGLNMELSGTPLDSEKVQSRVTTKRAVA